MVEQVFFPLEGLPRCSRKHAVDSASSGPGPLRSHTACAGMPQFPSKTGRTTFSECFLHANLQRSMSKSKSFIHTVRWHLMYRYQRLGVTCILKISYLLVHTGNLHAEVTSLKKPNLCCLFPNSRHLFGITCRNYYRADKCHKGPAKPWQLTFPQPWEQVLRTFTMMVQTQKKVKIVLLVSTLD